MNTLLKYISAVIIAGTLCLYAGCEAEDDLTDPYLIERPRILAVRAEPFSAAAGNPVRLQTLAVSGDGSPMFIAWFPPYGYTEYETKYGPWPVEGFETDPFFGAEVNWSGVGLPGIYRVRMRVMTSGGFENAYKRIELAAPGQVELNRNPVIEDIPVVAVEFSPGEVITFSVAATDPDGDEIMPSWYITEGGLDDYQADEVMYHLPNSPGLYSIYCVVRDGRGGLDWKQRDISVRSEEIYSGLSGETAQIIGEALIENDGRLIWIGITDESQKEMLKQAIATDEKLWLRGRAVVGKDSRYQFSFEPQSIELYPESTTGIEQTEIATFYRTADYANSYLRLSSEDFRAELIIPEASADEKQQLLDEVIAAYGLLIAEDQVYLIKPVKYLDR